MHLRPAARVPLGMYGTDAQLAPSKPTALLRYADHPRGFAELRMPEGNGPFPLAVIFHGGCFKTGIADQGYMAPAGDALAAARRGHAQRRLPRSGRRRRVGRGSFRGLAYGRGPDRSRRKDTSDRPHPASRSSGIRRAGLPALWLATPQGRGRSRSARASTAPRARRSCSTGLATLAASSRRSMRCASSPQSRRSWAARRTTSIEPLRRHRAASEADGSPVRPGQAARAARCRRLPRSPPTARASRCARIRAPATSRSSPPAIPPTRPTSRPCYAC